MKIKLNNAGTGAYANIRFNETTNHFSVMSVAAAREPSADIVFRMPCDIDAETQCDVSEAARAISGPDFFGMLDDLKLIIVGRATDLEVSIKIEHAFEQAIDAFYEVAQEGRIDLTTGEAVFA